ncbi:glucose 1-dehydrogenase [Bradyrhizobium sp. U87765 SZCCT0131]|uniref:SDR family NAD(P)-dependent oxidoreductase n=1 Tax=unclassified Bradyrhizobium TaxID=2631580 RepID=UPI001BA5CEBF|nr:MULTISPECIES: glucose 1-dehydrogenase [unclassified Bradyrhizobium]MBR1217830.1 glucose 1-dehydrogenase [Bradyrhizobium sp. U87765 SZCCT0131]MBR1261224.1 glucose 1-dehydrogenase [Bradyrhizobium sp. U87765 SZCCT0134]MBR1303328.1 glucose 1-dehydrogenase [Bradyrhizobium sp. U87765 SZCCT0110]MBR1318934.1 glucose 1-dehydrogenase [Bradyrhizobium sp. U87765 SZCCT0109]MBR1347259.1 glucose 1-dehydrogenase [Bradyrhizobium sp. U87765 SZCCT0048]
MTGLIGKIALVTGGTRGLGAATARRLVEDGAHVVIVGRDEAAARKLISSVDAGRRLMFIKADVGDVDAAADTTRRVVEQFGGIDILVNSAGGSKLMPFLDTDAATLETMLSVNLKGTFFFAQAVARTMVNRGRGGIIINISSISGQRGSTLRAAYGMAKSAIIQLTRVMAVELAPHGIRVNAIAPGPIETRAATERHLPTTRSAYLRTIPMRRYGTPEEVAATAMFLVSDAASYVTGHILNVDGGFCAAGIMEQEIAAQVSAA